LRGRSQPGSLVDGALSCVIGTLVFAGTVSPNALPESLLTIEHRSLRL
jgi:hypothetical protein